MKLTATWGKTYNLELIESNYTNNNKKYYWLYDKKDWEPFADITVNIPDWNHELNYIDNDFLLCFKDKMDCFDWIKKNLKATECGIDWNGRNYFKF
jgi:hypothetical protein